MKFQISDNLKFYIKEVKRLDHNIILHSDKLSKEGFNDKKDRCVDRDVVQEIVSLVTKHGTTSNGKTPCLEVEGTYLVAQFQIMYDEYFASIRKESIYAEGITD